jgi:hypothetical protein
MNKKKVFGFALLGAGLLSGITLFLYLREQKRIEQLNATKVSLNDAISSINSIK